METQETLTDRFTAQQEIQLTLIEKQSTSLQDHINFWKSVRLENVLAYYARREGYRNLGLQPLPVLAVSQYKAKEAIEMQLLLTSLNESEYANEAWTLADVSAELLHTPPKNCFKKGAFIVTVLYDNDEQKAFPYTCWDYIYYQDNNSRWHKVRGDVDTNGLFYTEVTGDIVYFLLFAPEAEKYGDSGSWTIKFKNQTVFASIASYARPVPGPSSEAGKPTSNTSPVSKSPRKRQRETDEDTQSASPTSTSRGFRLRRGEGESATTTRRRRGGGGGTTRALQFAVSPEEVGTRSESVPRQGLGRLGRLQAEARDPYLIVLKGHANTLKCWRYRLEQRHPQTFLTASTLFHWQGDDSDNHSRLLIAFSSDRQRQLFLQNVTLPKHSTHTFGNFDSL